MIKKYKEFINEGILDTLGRFQTGTRPKTTGVLLGRYRDDKYALKFFEKMKKDFEDSGKDLRKTKFFNDLKSMVYVFGEYSTTNNPDVSNHKAGDINVELRFNTIEIIKYVENPIYNPNYLGGFGNKMRRYYKKEEEFKISDDVSNKIRSYFLNEWDKKYPQLKKSMFRGLHQIKQIESGEKPTLAFVSEFSKNGIECTFQITDFNDIPKYKKWIKNNLAIEGKSKDGHPVKFCYSPKETEVNLEVDPFGEESDNTRDQEIINWINTTSKEEIQKTIEKEIQKY